MTHYLKILVPFANAVIMGEKTFEMDQTALYDTGASPLNLLVSVGIETEVTIEAKDAVPASVVKKLISLSERVALAYYQAYRESEGAI